MKYIKLLTGAFLLSIGLLFGCSKDEVLPTNENDRVENNENIADNNPIDKEVNEEPLFVSVTFEVLENGTSIGEFAIDLQNIESQFEIDDGRVEIILTDLFPDYYMTDNGPSTRSQRPVNPGFAFSVQNEEVTEGIFVVIGNTVLSADDPVFDINITGFDYFED